MAIRKPFDPKLYAENDSKARKAVHSFLAKAGFSSKDNSNRYGIDILGIDFQIECEVKYNWVGNEFPFDSLQIPERKEKYISPT